MSKDLHNRKVISSINEKLYNNPMTNITQQFSNEGTRQEVRMRLVKVFSKETPGKGRGDLASRYSYYVETLSDGNRIFLKRPANLYNGFDFLVCVENYDFASSGKRKRNYPKHEDIIKDLREKKASDSQMYKKFYAVLEKVYNCQDVEDSEYKNIRFAQGFPTDMVLKTLKWLFIEQDIRYWNYSGRDMLWSGIPKP